MVSRRYISPRTFLASAVFSAARAAGSLSLARARATAPSGPLVLDEFTYREVHLANRPSRRAA